MSYAALLLVAAFTHYSYAAPQIWNVIPLNIRNSRYSQSVSSFNRNLKTFYFAAAF